MLARALAAARKAMSPRGPLPDGLDAIDARSLSDLLGTEVTEAEILTTTEGTTDRARVRVAGDGLPETVFVKLRPAKRGTRIFGELAALGRTEVRFYRDVRPDVPVNAPKAWAAEYHDPTGQFALVLEDLAARSCRFFDTTAALDPDQAAAVPDQLASLHGHGAQALASGLDLSWAHTVASDPMLPLVQRGLRAMRRRVAARTDDAGGEAGQQLLRHYRRLAAELDEGPQTVLHGDCHPGNIYLEPDGRDAGLIDWQVLRRGNPIRDVTYFLVLALDPDDRRAHERALLAGYCARLAANGGPDLDPEKAWRYHRRSSAYAFVAAYFVAGVDGLQDDAIRYSGLTRAATAIADLDPGSTLATLTG